MDTHSPDLTNQLCMAHIIKEAFYVKLYDIMQMAQLQQLVCSADCVFH